MKENNKMIEQILNFNYVGYHMGSNKYNDTNIKLGSFKTYVVL